jgi:hypothetical protein
MRQIRLVALTVLIGTIVVIALGPSNIAHAAATLQVFVTNTPSQPVPVLGTVAVSSLPASQSVSGTVNVGNPATNPVLVRVVDDVRKPFEADSAGTFAGLATIHVATVPAGQVVVIEHLSAQISVPAGQQITNCTLFSNGVITAFGFFGNSHDLDETLLAQFQGTDGQNNFFTVNAQTKMYFGPGDSIDFGVSRAPALGGAGSNVNVFVSGYLTPAP